MAQPEKRFKVGACSASVFANEVKTEKGTATFRTVNLQRTYKDREGKFQSNANFALDDIPKAMLALSKAYEYMAMEDGQGASDGAKGKGAAPSP